MSFEIDRRRPVAREVKAVAASAANSACDILATARDAPEEAIHEGRKRLKKLRGLIRLTRDSLGEKVYKTENKTYRDAGRLLAPYRDAWVRLDLVRSFPANGDVAVQSALAELEATLQKKYGKLTKNHAPAKAADKARELIEEAIGRIEHWPLRGRDFDLFRGGLSRVYRRGKRGLRKCLANPTVENLHDWRKRCKYLRFHLKLLSDAWPEMMIQTEDLLHDLTNLLGDDHDFAVLRETLESEDGQGLTSEQLQALNDAIESRQTVMISQCWPLGRRLFAESTEDFVRRMEVYWRA